VNAKFLAVLALVGGVVWYLFGRKPTGKGVYNPFKTTGTASKPPQFGLKPPNNGGFGQTAARVGQLATSFGSVASTIRGLFGGSGAPRGGPNEPAIVEGPNGQAYYNAGNYYAPYPNFTVPPAPGPDEPQYTLDIERNFGLGDFAEPGLDGATLPDELPDFGGGLAPETGFDLIDTRAAEGLA